MQKAFAMILLLALLGSSVSAIGEETYFVFPSDQEAAVKATPDTQTAQPPATPTWTYAIARELLDDPLDVIRNVNRNNLLESDYPPSDDAHKMLDDTTVKKTKNVAMPIREIADEALARMFEDAAADGVTLLLHSAYRSYRTQAIMYENRLKAKGRDDGMVQYPGASDHQTGLGLDVVDPVWAKKDAFNKDFAKTDAAKWMAANCMRYGFIIRYPEDKVDVTGINYEPWHLRYVGVEVATYITEHGMALEEFEAEWRHALATFEVGGGTGPLVDVISF